VLSHLHDWDASRIYRALVRYNVSFILTWVEDVTPNLQNSPHFALVHQNPKVHIWAVQGHEFRFASGEGIRIDTLDFQPEQITWSLTSDRDQSPVTLAVAYHPNWKAWLNGARTSIRETEDHLMEVQIPRETSTLTLEFRRAWLETLVAIVSVASLALSLWLWLLGRRRGRTDRHLGFLYGGRFDDLAHEAKKEKA
jgi:hypothetical protein